MSSYKELHDRYNDIELDLFGSEQVIELIVDCLKYIKKLEPKKVKTLKDFFKKCELKWCKSGDTNTCSVNENIGDACYRINICMTCLHILSMKPLQDLPDANKVKKQLKGYYGVL